jgi:hypothetical protein
VRNLILVHIWDAFGFSSEIGCDIQHAHNTHFIVVYRQISTRDLEKYWLGRRYELIRSFKYISPICLTSDI